MTNYLNMELSTYNTLERKTMIVLNNKLPYANGHLEAHILFGSNGFRVLITDGYKYLYDRSGFNSLKQALNISHGRMIAKNFSK